MSNPLEQFNLELQFGFHVLVLVELLFGQIPLFQQLDKTGHSTD